ncbi:hypothetical protein IQ251_09075 [Saccharopolyspora sp. HNM0983]|uniref:Uncharacterized protein n=1 Tax=Saccharopolyspora montiporae TaxID=2781240 RepID=A0A929BBG0_9PSEU|nr:hypothetical protein [Saccharopolyspora sp. HNM0983]MBE9374598.1 hypothetical protein [Saccharopolyspora sp. HNM0983]
MAADGGEHGRRVPAEPALLAPRPRPKRRERDAEPGERRETVWNVAPIALSLVAGVSAGIFGRLLPHGGVPVWLAWGAAAALWLLVEYRLQTWYARRLRRQRAEDDRTSGAGSGDVGGRFRSGFDER